MAKNNILSLREQFLNNFQIICIAPNDLSTPKYGKITR